MFFNFFDELRAARIPVTLKEYLALMGALSKDVIDLKVEDFYYLSSTAPVKDERNLDKFDQVFGHVFKGLEGIDASLLAQIPEEWLKALTEKYLTDEEKKQIEDDRLGRHLAVRQFRLQPGRRAHRPGQGPPRQGGKSLGQARIQEPRR